MHDLGIMWDWTIMWEWLAFAVRWLHVVTAMAWIGSSFFFIALDLGLKRAPGLPAGVSGEEWQVHGGGFYHIRKYMVAPEHMPQHLIWHKWQSYTTWLSGAALLMIVYWAGGELFLIDPSKADLALWQGAVISAASLSVGWLVYDLLCKSGLGERPTALMIVLFILLVAMGWGYNQILTGRATMLHLGAFTATIMTANVFFVIIPNQRIVVKDLLAGRSPDPGYGKIAKLRSTHNNYLTLPVIFLMLSNHYPLAFASPWNWAIAALVFLMGVTIRHFFNTMHATGKGPYWTWAVTALLFVVIMWLSGAPQQQDTYEESQARAPSATEQVFASAAGFDEVTGIVSGRCSMCHSRDPSWDGIRRAPRGILLESPADIAAAARLIYLQAGASTAMPPANVTSIEEDERRAIRQWYQAARRELPFAVALR